MDNGRLTERDANGGIAVRDLPAALDKLAAYEGGVEKISERLKKEQENMRYAHDEAGKIEYAGIVYGLRNALLMLEEGKRINAEAAMKERKAAQQTDVGEWRESGDGFFRFCYCSRCGHKERRETSLPSLCPACGAQMKFRDDILKAIERGVKAAMKGGGA